MQRRKALERKTPLRPARVEPRQLNSRIASSSSAKEKDTGLGGPPNRRSTLSRRKPINVVSAKTKERSADWLAVVAEVRQRSRGFCEVAACGRRVDQADPHHIYKRNNRIPRRWADRPELIAAICRDCHRTVETKPRCEQQRQLEWLGLNRLAATEGWNLNAYGFDWAPLQILRDCIRNHPQEERMTHAA